MTPPSQAKLPPRSLEEINIPEIYTLILSFLDIPTCAKLMRVSLLWYELTGKIIYRDITYGRAFHYSPWRNNPLDVLPVLSHSTADCRSENDLQYQPSRTSKVALLNKYCRILRVNHHGSYSETYEQSCAAIRFSTLGGDLKPNIVVFDNLGSFFETGCGHWSKFNSNDTAAGEACALLRNVSPEKMVMREGHDPCERGDMPSRFMSLKEHVLIIHTDLLNSMCIGEHLDRYHPWEIECNLVIILSGLDRTSLIFDTLFIKQLVRLINSRHDNPHITTTLVVGIDLIWEDSDFIEQSETPGGKKFAEHFEKYFFFHHREHNEDGQRKAEEKWSRFYLLSKEEYLKRDSKELEGELDVLGW